MGCSVCAHADRAKIEAALAERGAEARTVALSFGISSAVLTRHARSHGVAPKTCKKKSAGSKARVASALAATPQPTPDVEEVEPPPTSRSHELASARDEQIALLRTIRKLLEQALADKEAGWAAKSSLVARCQSAIRTLGQFTGEIGASESTVATSAHYRKIRTAIVEALRPYPDAARAVLAALEREEGPSAGIEAAA